MYEVSCIDSYGNTLTHLTQWDYNQKLIVKCDGTDINDITQIQFANSKSTDAYCVAVTKQNDNLIADIPNILLTEPYTIYAYIWISDATAGKTQYIITIPLKKRPKPQLFEYVENTEIVDVVQIREDVEKIKAELEEKVDKTQYASISQYGIVKISSAGAVGVSNGVISVNTNSTYGTQKISNYVAISPATESEIASQTQSYKPITPKTLKKAVETIGGEKADLETDNQDSYVGAINEINENGYYTNNTPTPSKIGGIDAGTTFDDESIKSILGKLLYPYVAFTITSSSSTTYLEYGNSVSLTTIGASVTKGSNPITSFNIYADGRSINNTAGITTLNKLISGQSSTINTTINYVSSTDADGSISVTVSDGTTTNSKTLRTYKHVYPYYHGVVNEGDVVNSSKLQSFGSSGKDISAKGTKTYTYVLNNQIPVYASPIDYGEVSISDANTGTPYTFNKTEIVVNNSYDRTATYYVYKLSQPVTGTFQFKFAHK